MLHCLKQQCKTTQQFLHKKTKKMENINSQIKGLENKLIGIKVFEQFHSKTKLPRSYLVYGSTALYFLLVLLDAGGLGQILCNTIGFIFPSYLSLKALKTVNKSDDTDLLIYWVVYGFFNVIEFWSKSILGWIPFYFFFKTIFLAFIAIPQTGGAKVIYNKLISPFSDKYILNHKTSISATKITNELEEQLRQKATKASGFSN
jgi:receptor expression-enhancing protein 5/6